MSRNRSARIGQLQAIRSVGIDDGPFNLAKRGRRQRAPLVAVFFDGLTVSKIRASSLLVDGWDATAVVSRLLAQERFDVVILSGVTFAGFNVLDPWHIFKRFRKPVVIVTGDRPRNRAVKVALMKHFSDWKKRWTIFERLPKVHAVKTKSDEPPLYFEAIGASLEQVKGVLKHLSASSRIPEPIRVAGITARGLRPAIAN